MTAIIHPPNWSLQPFEEELATAEVHGLAGSCERRGDGAIVVRESLTSEARQQLVRRLSFASRIDNDRHSWTTQQAALEIAAGGGSRKVTSHALHGLHPYKGKFYPQLARALMNVCEIPDGGLVLDPFAGCGTTVIEASLLGIRGLGVDVNPLAVLVAQTKLRLLWADPERVRLGLGQIERAASARSRLVELNDDYLDNWFPPANYSFLRSAVGAIEAHPDEVVQDAARVALSSVLRRASWQDPRQLRVGRRKDGSSIEDLESLFNDALIDLLSQIHRLHAVEGFSRRKVERTRSRVVLGDSRDLRGAIRRFARRPIDAVITSPPYANALPYIDTDRLSLRAFGLMPEKSQRLAESNLIGNREITDRARRLLEDAIDLDLGEVASWVPDLLRTVLTETREVTREPSAGFRKQRTPALLYKYFRDMQQVGIQLADLIRPGGHLALVIGENTVSGPGGSTITVPSADILAELLARAGFTPKADLSKRLTSFGAPSTVHQRNAMADERVLVFVR
ncbi:MAG TPA: hypothetical protein ENH00_03245 [Actinobacteria bacterium]|nr:DNA methylase [bacterium BMS3Bbin01]HDH25197.1 hypothetical protein [Actinomycetota bacterium]